jgi:hypothetical protein
MRYLPVVLMRRPLMTDVVNMPMVRGTVNRPDRVAVEPPTIWRNSGAMMLTLVKTVPTTKCVVTTVANNRSRKRWRGKMGSAARLSTQMNVANPTTKVPSARSILGDAQPSCSPKVRYNMIAVTQIVMVSAPR